MPLYLVPHQIQKLQAAWLPGCRQYTRTLVHPRPSKLQLAAFPFDRQCPIVSVYNRESLGTPQMDLYQSAKGSDILQQTRINVTQPKLAS